MANPPQPADPVIILSDGKRLIETDNFAPLSQLMDDMTTGQRRSPIRLFKLLIEKKKMSLIVNPYETYGFNVIFEIETDNEFRVAFDLNRQSDEKADVQIRTNYRATVQNGDVFAEYHHTMKRFLDKIPTPIDNFSVTTAGSVREDIRAALYPMMEESYGNRVDLPRVKKFTMSYSGKAADEPDVMGFLPYVQLVDEKQLVFRPEEDFGRKELRLQRVFGTQQWTAARELSLEGNFWCKFNNQNWWRFERALLECDTLRRVDFQAFIENIFETNRLSVDYTIFENSPAIGGEDEFTEYCRSFTRDFDRGYGQVWYTAKDPKEEGAGPMHVGFDKQTFYFQRP